MQNTTERLLVWTCLSWNVMCKHEMSISTRRALTAQEFWHLFNSIEWNSWFRNYFRNERLKQEQIMDKLTWNASNKINERFHSSHNVFFPFLCSWKFMLHFIHLFHTENTIEKLAIQTNLNTNIRFYSNKKNRCFVYRFDGN